MRDFEAVVRRVVEGLDDNTPEVRTKVYDKARGAVGRQLRSMDPKPARASVLHQMRMLEAAIIAIEREQRVVAEKEPVEATLTLSWTIESTPNSTLLKLLLPASLRGDFLSNLQEVYADQWRPAYGSTRAKWIWHQQCVAMVARYWLQLAATKACRLWSETFK